MPPPVQPAAPAVRARNLTRVFGSGAAAVRALNGVNLDIPYGEFVAIMGPSGSGKSTLLNQVGLLDRPTGGSLLVAGRPTEDLEPDQRADMRARMLGFVFQTHNLVASLTAIQNVMLPLAFQDVRRRERRQRAQSLLERLGLGDRLHHRPRQLSGGQRQRVAVARALALDPPILLADEPTGSLDSMSKHEVMRIFQEIHRRGRTVILITHDESQARYADRLVRFADGQIVADLRRKVTT